VAGHFRRAQAGTERRAQPGALISRRTSTEAPSSIGLDPADMQWLGIPDVLQQAQGPSPEL
jgi:hypothetical protein